MQSKESKKEAVRQFKERKSLLGAYAIRCTVTGRVWVGASKNLNATKNGSWFTLRNGLHREKSLQEEWTAHGESAFLYEILVELDEDIHPLEVDDLLKEQKQKWLLQLGARPLP
ncbi:MAG: GIY-YIG nuclease family protein [Terracidiphilus sp.]